MGCAICMRAAPPLLPGAALSTTECRNKGYILQGFPETLAQATLLSPQPLAAFRVIWDY